ncbi:ring-cleaving dioxygenase [Thermus sp.]|uniref:ring-cleaving dioxygenase n=1 Tax=Thermus sp. TaxID=275 RepID=UPI0025F6FB43|nr:ring-cleaving dioxygenase [Thermus sp.]MCS6869235.1 ring-cleaving dioxygenase [Thermus sp.]MDW8358625.1 ring-cleaving dioxygenase [Thermus sp.]
MEGTLGLHHITCIAGDPQENLDFYAGVLGLRLVKRSVNQDDPTTYHLFYADREGTPGTDLTFFPWPHLPPARPGVGQAVEVALAVPEGSLPYWEARLEGYGVRPEGGERFGRPALLFQDPHGLPLALAEAPGPGRPWEGSPVPQERQVRGLLGARILERDPTLTLFFLEGVLGFRRLGEEGGWVRLVQEGSFLEVRGLPGGRRGAWGVGGVHHLAFRIRDEAHGLGLRERVLSLGLRPTPVVDRFWFRSIYFLEPGGVLLELATDGPGFGVDEPGESLGERLVLPPWLEGERRAIEASLPPLHPPRG